MNKLILFLATTVLCFSACKKAPTNINNNYITVYVDSTNTGDDDDDTPTTLFHDSSAIAGESYDSVSGIGFQNLVGIIRELPTAQLPFTAYGANTIGCELAVEFTFFTDRTGVRFDADQSLQVNFPNNQYVAQAHNVETISSGTDGSFKWWRLRSSIIVMRDINATPLALSVTLEDFYYYVNNRPYALSINATTNGVMFLKKPKTNSTL